MSVKSVLTFIYSEDKTSVLLIKRRDVPLWVLPGGRVEEGETLEACAIREAEEETGFKIKLERKVATYYPGKSYFIKPVALFSAVAVKKMSAQMEETREAKFFLLKELPDKIPPPFPIWIADTQKNAPYFEDSVAGISLYFVIKTIFLHPIYASRFLLSRIGLHWNSN